MGGGGKGGGRGRHEWAAGEALVRGDVNPHGVGLGAH